MSACSKTCDCACVVTWWITADGIKHISISPKSLMLLFVATRVSGLFICWLCRLCGVQCICPLLLVTVVSWWSICWLCGVFGIYALSAVIVLVSPSCMNVGFVFCVADVECVALFRLEQFLTVNCFL